MAAINDVIPISKDEGTGPMAQVKIYGLRQHLDSARQALSTAIQHSLVKAFSLPSDKKFQRFIALDKADFIYPQDRSTQYTIIEISFFSGRSDRAKQHLIEQLYENVWNLAGIPTQDLEITLFESPKHHWGIRGVPADQLQLDYKVEI